MHSHRAVVIALFLSWSTFCVIGAAGETNRFTFCSRILSASEAADVSEDTEAKRLGVGNGDPIACKNRGGAVPLKDGVEASSCQESVVDLNGSDSSFARKLDAGGKSGSLLAFTADISYDAGVIKRTVCFKHDVPMGGSQLSDDSPRCFKGNNQPFLMFIAKTCPHNSSGCITHWLLAIDGKCDGSFVNQLENIGATNGGDKTDDAEKQDSEKKPTPIPPPPRSPELSGVPLPPVDGGE